MYTFHVKLNLSILHIRCNSLFFLTPCSEHLCVLARVCAEVCVTCGSKVNKELMGAFRALCIPGSIIKTCHTGFTPLVHRTNVRFSDDILLTLNNSLAIKVEIFGYKVTCMYII